MRAAAGRRILAWTSGELQVMPKHQGCQKVIRYATTFLARDDQREAVKPISAGAGYATDSIAARRDERVPEKISRQAYQ